VCRNKLSFHHAEWKQILIVEEEEEKVDDSTIGIDRYLITHGHEHIQRRIKVEALIIMYYLVDFYYKKGDYYENLIRVFFFFFFFVIVVFQFSQHVSFHELDLYHLLSFFFYPFFLGHFCLFTFA